MSEVNELNIEDILAEWEVDCKIDQTHITDEICRTPSLHSKYLKYYQQYKYRVVTLEKSHRRMEVIRRRYYKGASTQEELEKFGWEQWQFLKPKSATEMRELLECDEPLALIKDNIEKAETGVKTMEYILKAISERGFALKNIVDYVRYENGA